MQKTTDDHVAVPLMTETLTRFPAIASASFDKGFHSPSNQTDLAELIPRVVMPKKGKLSLLQPAREQDPEFVARRHRHSAVESAINALEVHGLDRCPDHGIDGFKRYVALAVVARNIQQLGALLSRQEMQARERQHGLYRRAAYAPQTDYRNPVRGIGLSGLRFKRELFSLTRTYSHRLPIGAS